jgi:hypothetical protein
MQDYINKIKSIKQRIIGAGGTIDDDQLKARLLSDLTSQYAAFKSTFRLMDQANKETVNQVCQILISKEYSRNKTGLDKEQAVNHVLFNQSQKEKGANNNTFSKQRDKYKICNYFHKGECFVKTGKIPSDWSDVAKGRLRERIYQYRKDKTSINTNTVDDDPMIRTNGKKRKRTEKNKVCTLLTIN